MATATSYPTLIDPSADDYIVIGFKVSVKEEGEVREVQHLFPCQMEAITKGILPPTSLRLCNDFRAVFAGRHALSQMVSESFVWR